MNDLPEETKALRDALIALLDSLDDDFPNVSSRQADALLAPTSPLVTGGYLILGPDGKPLDVRPAMRALGHEAWKYGCRRLPRRCGGAAMTDLPDPPLAQQTDPRFVAGYDLLRRCGAKSIRLSYTDPEEGDPTVWTIAASVTVPVRYMNGRRSATENRQGYVLGVGLVPLDAVLDACENAVDGGECAHCKRPTIFAASVADALDFENVDLCTYGWDPELSTFRRSCEGTS